MKSKVRKAVLAYSGGLDTSIIIPWLRENYGCEVIAVTGSVVMNLFGITFSQPCAPARYMKGGICSVRHFHVP
jgi:PP-loop superfamily ATP-utilizing enzyme